MRSKIILGMFCLLLLSLVISGCAEGWTAAGKAVAMESGTSGKLFVRVETINTTNFYFLPGTEVYVDGFFKNSTYSDGTVTISNLSSGSHEIKLSKVGYLESVHYPLIYEGKTTNITTILYPVTLSSLSTGFLNVQSPLYTSFYVDNVSIYYMSPNKLINGYFSALIKNLSPGQHEVKLNKSGYKKILLYPVIEAGKLTKVDFSDLTPMYGSLLVISNPANASVYVDGSFKGYSVSGYGESSKAIKGILTGEHNVKVSKSGYNDYTTTRTITDGALNSFSVTLTSTKSANVTKTGR